MSSLIIGGTSGLGLEIARQLEKQGRSVIVMGQEKPPKTDADYVKLNLSHARLPKHVKSVVHKLPQIDELIYVAGHYKEGTITHLSENDIEQMINYGGRGLIYFVRELLAKQHELKTLVTVTSSSQWMPRRLEPVYNFIMAGECMFSNAMSKDDRISRVLVAAPTGLQIRAEDDPNQRNVLADMLDPIWVAATIIRQTQDDYRYRFVKIVRSPQKVEVIETR